MASICTVPDVDRVFAPDPAEQAMLQPRHERFLRLYRDL
jgi:hypothetical protein